LLSVIRATLEAAHRPSAEAVEAWKFLSDCHTGPECSREPVRVFPTLAERSYTMSSATDSSHGNAQLRRQKELTERLCITPVRRSKGHNLNWSTWKWRLRMRGKATA
jgi:hypothetical protein